MAGAGIGSSRERSAAHRPAELRALYHLQGEPGRLSGRVTDFTRPLSRPGSPFVHFSGAADNMLVAPPPPSYNRPHNRNKWNWRNPPGADATRLAIRELIPKTGGSSTMNDRQGRIKNGPGMSRRQ